MEMGLQIATWCGRGDWSGQFEAPYRSIVFLGMGPSSVEQLIRSIEIYRAANRSMTKPSFSQATLQQQVHVQRSRPIILLQIKCTTNRLQRRSVGISPTDMPYKGALER
jgi:hypothetical protein